jgi:dTDP-4-dehydrorhamnose 3,5-epimerase
VQPNWSLTGTKDKPQIEPDWSFVDDVEICDLVLKRIDNVPTDDGYLTEIWRRDWLLDEHDPEQVFQRLIEPGTCSGWHAHARSTDRLFCAFGRIKLGLFDGRLESPTHGAVAEIRIGIERPAMVVIPPGVWHGVRNLGSTAALYVNVTSPAYDYGDPDHFREPSDSRLIPIEL